MSVSATRDTINDVFRMESARLIASLVRIVRDMGLAEELAQDALVAALEQWPTPASRHPAAWLRPSPSTARSNLRRGKLLERSTRKLGRELDDAAGRAVASRSSRRRMDDEVGDDLLRLIFTACHPVLSTEARVAFDVACCSAGLRPTRSPGLPRCRTTIAQRIVAEPSAR